MPAVLKITDGSTEINFIKGAGQAGFHLARWRPAISPYKGGGTWQDSPLSDGRRLADRKFENAIESFDLKLVGANQDGAIRESRLLRILLEKAADYWTSSWQNEPVWLEARATCETNLRYAIVHVGAIPEDDNPFAQPFLQANGSAVMDNLTLVVERGPWLSCQPGTGTATAASALEAYDGRNLGNVDTAGVRQPTTADEVYVANKRNVSNLTDVWYWDSVGGAWSAINLMDAALPFALFQNPPAAGDVVVFGTDNTLADSGPFCSLVFDLLTAQNDLTITWRYSRTGADVIVAPWPALDVTDNTSSTPDAAAPVAFELTGINSVHWAQPSDWAPFNPTVGGGAALGVTGLWVAAHVTAVGAAPAAPVQQNRDIYSIVWPYTEVQSGVVGGDIPAVARIRFRNRSDRDAWGGFNPELWANRVILGLRSVERGALFTAYLNAANEQNPAGVTCTAAGGAAFTADTTTPSGVRLTWTPGGGAGAIARCTWTIDSATAPHFYGTFHVFVRARETASAGLIFFFVRLYEGSGNPPFDTPTFSFSVTTDWQLVDFGRMTIGGKLSPSDRASPVQLQVVAGASAAGSSLYVYDLILMPVDEWAGDYLDLYNFGDSQLKRTDVFGTAPAVITQTLLDVDGISFPKERKRSLVRYAVNEEITAKWQDVGAGISLLQSSSRQKLWSLTTRYDAPGSSTVLCEPWIGHTIQLERVQRYLSMRGAG